MATPDGGAVETGEGAAPWRLERGSRPRRGQRVGSGEWGVRDFEARVNLKGWTSRKPTSYWAGKVCVGLGFKYYNTRKLPDKYGNFRKRSVETEIVFAFSYR